MQLHHVQRHEAGDAGDVLARLVDEQADRAHKRRQRPRDRPRPERIDEAGAVRPEDESDRARPRIDGGDRILNARDAADLDEHQWTTLNALVSFDAAFLISSIAAVP